MIDIHKITCSADSEDHFDFDRLYTCAINLIDKVNLYLKDIDYDEIIYPDEEKIINSIEPFRVNFFLKNGIKFYLIIARSFGVRRAEMQWRALLKKNGKYIPVK